MCVGKNSRKVVHFYAPKAKINSQLPYKRLKRSLKKNQIRKNRVLSRFPLFQKEDEVLYLNFEFRIRIIEISRFKVKMDR